MMISYIFRKRTATAFSIEKQFDALYGHFETYGLRLHRLELPRISTGIVSVMRNAFFVAHRRRTKTLHITGDVHYAALLCPFSRTIITVHDCVVLQRGRGLKRFVLWALWFGLPMRLATAITVVSEHTKKELMAVVAVPEKKITVVPVPLDPAFKYSDRPFAKDRPRLLHIGTTPNKNLHRVAAALCDIRCVLVIVGPLSPETLAILRECNVHYENMVGIDHAAISRLYTDADIISFPSTYEGFGMPIIEGQATGRPVLTSDLEPMRSVAGPGGALLVDPQSVNSIRAGFIRLLEDPVLRDQLIAAGTENCRRFTLASVTESYLAVYRSIGGFPDSRLDTGNS